ncbi:hypothetical protein P7K49_035414, partial [Saguinus oedipus]
DHHSQEIPALMLFSNRFPSNRETSCINRNKDQSEVAPSTLTADAKVQGQHRSVAEDQKELCGFAPQRK